MSQRWYCGEDHHMAKLTAGQVMEIRSLVQKGSLSLRQIGKVFGVSKATVFDIKTNRTWRWQNDELPTSTIAASSTAQ